MSNLNQSTTEQLDNLVELSKSGPRLIDIMDAAFTSGAASENARLRERLIADFIADDTAEMVLAKWTDDSVKAIEYMENALESSMKDAVNEERNRISEYLEGRINKHPGCRGLLNSCTHCITLMQVKVFVEEGEE
jgi:hypothetical protein